MQPIGTILLVIGGILFLAWLVTHPRLREIITARTRQESGSQSRIWVGESVTDRQNFQRGSSIHFDPSGSGSRTALRHTITGIGEFHALNNNGGRNFSERGERYEGVFCDDMFFLRRPEGWYALITATGMPGETIHQFDAAGLAFGDEQHRQMPGSVNIDWDGKSWAMQDEGYMRLVLSEGEAHIDDGTMVKYIIAESSGEIFFMENVQSGLDRVWTGIFIGPSLDGYVFES